ncbi:UDP-N-acetylmuramoyl-L-alanine--D-glutamate ligase [Salisediminibacterium halotolerans]|uniref:UDP-N-acetylmuramoylalanine--D-glutamate ligase n=1 Tax=Salisediminibacterium halotolerans TaxID=517425 RepID=A0A1H9PV40_9BACI|nr:UDP-N-acetylmuramoyl-L-alanine--D-glutamate ligase [Salisediminibacterium haloalkalitolerans]SER51978.1 UDP-N-acetylmuramoylalanine--D-glutamate ligase [Salisediminibacterium haloalkalitolerans]
MKEITVYNNKYVLVLGLAKSGTEAAKLLLKLGANVTVNDQTAFGNNPAAQELADAGADVICGEHPEELIHQNLFRLVKNPGIRYDHPLVKKAKELGVPVITEVELAYEIAESEMIGITGSNGKTTTTTLTGEMLEGAEVSPLLAGNIGEVACRVAQEATSEDVMVVELSSFQLMGIRSFRPKISVILNLYEAHLDYHGTLEEYKQAKANIFANQTEDDLLIYNADDPAVTELISQSNAQKIPFSTRSTYEHGAYVADGWLHLLGEKIIEVEKVALPGEHNIANGLAAAAAAYSAGADVQQIAQVLATFDGVKHRLQFVKEVAGRRVVNNSKATNVPATITALKAFPAEQIVLIAGGLDRGNSFDDLIPYVKKNVKGLVAYGETKEKLLQTAEKANIVEVKMCETLEEAVHEGYKMTAPKDILLLSPACASWDQFKTFEERGDRFIKAVENLDVKHSDFFTEG